MCLTRQLQQIENSTHSFIRLFICSFIHSFVHSFIPAPQQSPEGQLYAAPSWSVSLFFLL